MSNDSVSDAIAKSIVASTARSTCRFSTRFVASTACRGSAAILCAAASAAVEHLAVGAHVVGEPDLRGPLRRDPVAGERVLLGEQQARVQRPRERAAVGGDEADRHVRIRQVRRLGHVHDVGERDHAAAEPDRGPVDRGDDRHAAPDHVEHELATLGDHGPAQRAVVRHPVEEIEVAAGRERAALAR